MNVAERMLDSGSLLVIICDQDVTSGHVVLLQIMLVGSRIEDPGKASLEANDNPVGTWKAQSSRTRPC